MLQCVDIEFAEPEDCEEVTPDNCFNSSDISFADVYTTASLSAAPALRPSMLTGLAASIPLLLMGLFGLL